MWSWLPTLEVLKLIVPALAATMSVITFCIYVYKSPSEAQLAEKLKELAPKTADGKSFAPGTAADVVSITKALSELATALGKLSPSVVALIASVLFLAIAALSTGALQSAPPASGADKPALAK